MEQTGRQLLQYANVPTILSQYLSIFNHFWEMEMATYDIKECFLWLLNQPNKEYITIDDFFPYIKELLSNHPDLEFLSNHAKFQDK